MTHEQALAAINAVVTQNGTGAITGTNLNGVLLDIMDSRPAVQNGASALYQSPVRMDTGNNKVSLTNGSSAIGKDPEAVSGNFLSADPMRGMDYFYEGYVYDGAKWFYLSIGSITDADNAVLADHNDVAADPAKAAGLGALWTGQTGVFEIYTYANLSLGASVSDSMAVLGQNNFDFGFASGEPSNNFVLGFSNILQDGTSSSFVLGESNKTAKNSTYVVGGRNNDFTAFAAKAVLSDNNTSNASAVFVAANNITANGAGTAWIDAAGSSDTQFAQNNTVLGCSNIQLGPATAPGGVADYLSENVVLAFNGLATTGQIDQKGVKNHVIAPYLMLTDIPAFADDAAAGTGGLQTGQVYKTITGELRIKL